MERMQLTRKLILLLLLFPSLALAQIDIPVQTLGNYFSAGQNLTWGASGTGGFNNNFILPGLGGITTNMCVFVQNGSTAIAHSFSLKAYVQSNPTVNSFTGNTATWAPLQVSGAFFSQGSYIVQSGLGGNIAPFLVRGATGAKIALSFSGATGTDSTANVYGMYTYGTSCSSYLGSGINFNYYNASITSSSSVKLLGKDANSLYFADPSSFNSCTITAHIVNTAGTTPTLNLYVDGEDLNLALLTDKMSFLQATTLTSNQQGSIALTGNSNPVAMASGSLTAGTVVSGGLTDELILDWVTGGTNPAYTLNVMGHCE